MNQGLIEQEGTPDEVVTRPATPFVSSFLGTSNFVLGTVEGADDGSLRVELGSDQLARLGLQPGEGVYLKAGKR
jgi:ABC-type Fe3+/spermidine/putrescine transport system ATPase subunit